ncbi:HEAT repeat-containing protein 4-like [Liolophura sinensis]|uniref:HEAT repeat-containing protein 4-like n=1 Tax=Liolophura sinensis TaxID=3198878 RepID=UPI003159418F
MSKTSNKMNLPTLFPCGSKVNVPQMGSDEGLNLVKPKTLPPFLNTLGNKSGPVSRNYIKKISTDIVFSEDVVRDRCFHMLPYDEKYFYEALDLSTLISVPNKSHIPLSRHNSRLPLSRHMPCHLTKTPTHLKPMSHKKCLKIDDTESKLSEGRSTKLGGGKDTPQRSPVFMTESEGSGDEDKDAKSTTKPDTDSKHGWDAYLMSMLSSSTAHWIVHKRMSPCEEQSTLNSLLLKWHGQPEHTDLIREDMSEEFDLASPHDKIQKKPWKKSEANLLDKVYGEPKPEAKRFSLVSSSDLNIAPEGRRKESMGQTDMTVPSKGVDPYSEDNAAPFYRQPAGVRRQKKHQDRENAVGINSTARDIEVTSFKPPSPVTLRDVIHPKVTSNTLYETDNLFQQEWLTGVQQISCKSGPSKTKIMMASDNMYEKKLQTTFPRDPESWYPDKHEEKGRKKLAPQRVPRKEKGMHKWKALPEPIDDTADVIKIISPDYDPDLRGSPDPIARKNTKQNMSMLKILDEWQSQWHLAGQYADSTPDDLIHDMADIQPHVRLKAVATVTKAVTYRPPQEPGIQIEAERGKLDPVSELPIKIFKALEYLLDDKHRQVKRAAAIALFSLNKPNPQAEEIMREALKGDNSVDRWAAAQCLAHYGVCDPVVVGELIQQLLATEDSIKHERAIGLLAKVSSDSMLVHSMVAEHLNSSSWRHKVIACKVFPTLHSNINKDISQKLANLMWNDWNKEVRSAAAQALGKTGHGKIVHDHLCEKILHGPERMRVEAIARVGQLGIMTARLLQPFLQCFDDPYISVRSEACVTAGQIQIKEPAVIKKLIYRATYDTTWKVKAMAVHTLGRIGVASPEVKACLLWALRYEEKEGVRAEACHSLIVLGAEAVDSDDVIDALQERLLVETSELVRQQITDALKMVGINALDDVDMVADIKDAVRKLCTCSNIAAQIAGYEAEEDKARNKSRMIQLPKEIPGSQEDTNELEKSRASPPDKIWKRLKKRASTPIPVPPSRPVSQGNRSSKASTPRGLPTETRSKGIMPRRWITPKVAEELDCPERAVKMPLSVYMEDGATLGQSHKRNMSRSQVYPSRQRESVTVIPLPVKWQKSCTELHPHTPHKYQYKLAKLASGTPKGTDEVPSRSSSRRKLVSREVQRERDRVQMGAQHSYNGLDVRYSILVGHLDNVDNAYQGPVIQQAVLSKSTGFEVSPVDMKSVSTAGEMLADGSHTNTE